MHENQYPYGPCHQCGGAIAIPGHDRYYRDRGREWLPHPKNHRESKPINTDKSVRVFRLPESQLTIDLQGGEL
jgi:hypothetical protein